METLRTEADCNELRSKQELEIKYRQFFQEIWHLRSNRAIARGSVEGFMYWFTEHVQSSSMQKVES